MTPKSVSTAPHDATLDALMAIPVVEQFACRKAPP
jgi:hypothetical protein